MTGAAPRRAARGALLLVVLAAGGCHPGAPAHPGQWLAPSSAALPDDDLPLGPLVAAVQRHAELLERTSGPDLHFGPRRIPRAEYAAALRRFAALAEAATSSAALREAAGREFELYEARFDPRAGGGAVLVTAYYEPILEGARAPSARFSQPLYRLPPGSDYRRTPGPTRADIDAAGALAGRGLELCWVDPLDAFVLQTEGSGEVVLDDGSRLALDYAGNNGRPHVRLGAALAGRIPPARMNMHTIEAYLRALPDRERRAVLETNPRYVFFRPRQGGGATTAIGLPAVEGRTIATDPRFVPRGALAFLSTEAPRFGPGDPLVPAGWAPLARFVLDEDSGGGIKGARVDLFWGRGPEARRMANAMKRPGRLLYLAPRR